MSDKQDAKTPHLRAKDFKGAEFDFPQYKATLPIGTPIEALKDPAYWANVAQMMNVPGMIHAMPVDGSYYARLMVRSKGPNWAHVALVEHVKFESAESVVNKAKGFDIAWGTGKSKFKVLRLADKAVMKEGFQTREEAAEWLAANVQAATA